MEAGGEDLVFHLRGPRTGGRALYSLARGLKGPSEATGCTMLVNDRVDLALALDLSGAHLGQRSLPPRVGREILGPRRILGLSVHGAKEALEGPTGVVDFLLVGSVFPSRSHPAGLPGGVGLIQEVRKTGSAPPVAIGGITPERVEQVRQAGAHGVAVLGGIWDAGDPKAAVEVYLEELAKGRGT